MSIGDRFKAAGLELEVAGKPLRGVVNIRERALLIRKKAPVGRGGGRPHVADEAISLEGGRRYARGAVRHPDHRTLHLATWHQVHLDREARTSSSPFAPGTLSSTGILWID